MIIARERPGVYSDYSSSGILRNTSNTSTVGIVANCSKGEALNVYTIKRASDAKVIFGSDSLVFIMCKLALQNGASTLKVVLSGGDSDENYNAAFNIIKTEADIKVLLCDSESVSKISYLKESVMYSSDNQKERIGIVGCNKEDALSLGEQLNCERIIEIFQKPLDENSQEISPNALAAALAGKISNSSDPSASFNSISLDGIYGLDATLIEEEVDEYLSSGITVFEVIASKGEVIRAVTTRTTTDGSADRTFHDINTILIIDDVIPSIRKELKKFISSSRNNQRTRSAIATQTVVLLENKKLSGIIDSYKSPEVYPLEEDSSICVVEVEFSVAKGINQIVISAVISV